MVFYGDAAIDMKFDDRNDAIHADGVPQFANSF